MGVKEDEQEMKRRRRTKCIISFWVSMEDGIYGLWGVWSSHGRTGSWEKICSEDFKKKEETDN